MIIPDVNLLVHAHNRDAESLLGRLGTGGNLTTGRFPGLRHVNPLA